MKDLPTDIGSFSTIIENNYVYIDKTNYIHKMAKPGKKYFLSRPRRFGKSLLVSTIEELYGGNKHFFKHLAIYDNWDWTKNFPVLIIDFASITNKSPERLEKALMKYLIRKARTYSIDFLSNELPDMFTELIESINKITGKKVVVLIDEYDKAIVDNINDLDLALEIRRILNSFYGALKTVDKHLEFLFVTGVSKFSKTSIFSGLNNLTDLTFNAEFANICGYTQDDLETNFKDYLIKFSNDNNVSCDELLFMIKDWYDGYSWDGSNHLYNPYSILSFFTKGEFSDFWFETGTPTFLMDFIKNNIGTNVLFDKEPIISGNFPSFKLKKLDLTTLLLQTGYLTVKEKYVEFGELTRYKLAIPNREVNNSLFTSIIEEYTTDDTLDTKILANKFLNSVININNEDLQEVLDILVSSVPAILFGKIKKDIRETNFHIWFLSWLKLMGFFVLSEISSSSGTLDVILKKDNLIVVCELKYGLSEDLAILSKKAISQIKEKNYYSPYLEYDVILLGIGFGDREVKSLIEPLTK